jgi:peptidoglycan/xylan/chitin deacetylase (PgdA/CDA1 family)
MQYPQSLPLADKEVVLTFDDGPIPPHSTAVLDILAAQCVKATFFLVGEMAREFPAVVRRIHEEGHTIGTHTEHHPARMHKLPIDKVRTEIDRGIADIGGALWDSRDLAPFFRIPGLARSDAIEKELADRSLVVFSSDTVADDWHRRIRSADITRLALSRLEARGRGILLLHDIHPVTVAALPDLLNKLKAAGFHVVHIVPGTSEQPELASASPPREAALANAASVTPPGQPPVASAAAAPSAGGATPPEHNDTGQQASAVVAPSGPSADAPPADAPAAGSGIAANVGGPGSSDAPHPTTAASPDRLANADISARPDGSEGDQATPEASTGVEPPQATSDGAHDPDDPNWPSAVAASPAEDRTELPAPDERAFAIDYRPWRTMKLADGSETARYFALDAVPQWSDPPSSAEIHSDRTELPVPAIPYFQGTGDNGGEAAE